MIVATDHGGAVVGTHSSNVDALSMDPGNYFLEAGLLLWTFRYVVTAIYLGILFVMIFFGR